VKKEKVKIQVLRRMTKDDIENLGGNLWMRRKAKALIIGAILSVVWLVTIVLATEPSLLITYVAVAPMVAVWVCWLWRFTKAGKKLWNDVKDKKQPVDLG